jgi:hypothetical protein
MCLLDKHSTTLFVLVIFSDRVSFFAQASLGL